MTSMISEEFHRRFKEKILRDKSNSYDNHQWQNNDALIAKRYTNLIIYIAEPMTLLIDSSHDSATNHICVLLIQTLEDGEPIVYFWRALELNPRSTSQEYTRAVVKAMKDDQLFPLMKDFLVGWTSDGANNMIGVDAGAAVQLEEALNRTLFKGS